MGNNSFLIIAMVVIIAFFFFWTWRNNRKRQRDEADKTSKLVIGADVMTNFGLFGTIHELRLDDNKIVLETSPGNFVTVHRQTIARIEDPAGDSAESATDATSAATTTTNSAIDEANSAAQAEAAKTAEAPAYGERITPTSKNDE